jgi:hypothetical protein
MKTTIHFIFISIFKYSTVNFGKNGLIKWAPEGLCQGSPGLAVNEHGFLDLPEVAFAKVLAPDDQRVIVEPTLRRPVFDGKKLP